MIVDLWLRYILVHWFFCTERGQCDKIAALGDNTIFSLSRGVIKEWRLIKSGRVEGAKYKLCRT